MQRHHPRVEIEAACAEAGLDVVAVRGHLPGGRLVPDPDEDLHPKLDYLARKPDPARAQVL